MKRRSQSKLELAVGALVSVSAAVFLVFAFTGGGLFNTTWELREHDKVLATVGSLQMHAHYPVPLAAALLSFTLIKHGVPGEAKLGIPEFHWA